MILREFIYFDNKHKGMIDDHRYLSDNDTSIYNIKDTRKSRLTLKMLKELRLAGEAREKEYKEEMGLVRKMYAAPPPEAASQ
ncbi:hypothetical protein EB118_17560 [bacterium]|nr:hypothetical protein [Synechococcaceae bacterium WB6_1A_059]NDG31866.1 hypothetical protein [bacterium]NDG78987.1 hypothetical protein [Synechococcaceae bacterium WB8_1B_057]